MILTTLIEHLDVTFNISTKIQSIHHDFTLVCRLMNFNLNITTNLQDDEYKDFNFKIAIQICINIRFILARIFLRDVLSQSANPLQQQNREKYSKNLKYEETSNLHNSDALHMQISHDNNNTHS